ncbi:MAG: hypothetical protein HUU55_01070 [Myxococcales bacterium]|nr:hypothetical protein [Myxococcales bacterium]
MIQRFLFGCVVICVAGLVACETVTGGDASCNCTTVGGRVENTIKCTAEGLSVEQYVCENTSEGLFCGQNGSSTETFSSATTGCGNGFCISDDGENCSQPCACSQ